jgi:hypothetical protein
MSGAKLPLPHYAFTAWCSVKTQGQLHLLPLPLTFYMFILSKPEGNIHIRAMAYSHKEYIQESDIIDV